MKKLIVIGSSNTDMVIRSGHLPAPGETVMGSSFAVIQGGKGANQAVAAARAGGVVTFLAKVGNDDFGNQAIAGYQADGINTNFITKSTSQPTGIAVILVDEQTGENSIVVAPGANGTLTPTDIEVAEAAIRSANVLLVQLEIPLETVRSGLEIAKRHGLTTILNPAPAQTLPDDLLSLVDIITPNETEIALLTGKPVNTKAEIAAAAQHLLTKVNQTVIVTLGADGAYFAHKNGTNGIIPTLPVTAVDTTAAGDVFNGYLAVALSDGKDLSSAIRVANAAAALSVTKPGAQPSVPYRKEIEP